MRIGFMVLPRNIEDTRQAARIGEAAGFDWMGVADSPTVYQESYLHQLEAANATERIKVAPMTSHLVARHPVIVGNLLATLNEITDGRAVGTITTGNSAARGLGMKPAKLAELAEGFEAIRGYWRGEGGPFKESAIPASGIVRRGCPLILGADGPKATALAGEIGDGLLYGGSMDPEVRKRRLAAGKTRPDQEAWLAPTVSLGETHDAVRDDLGAMVVAMANRAMRGDLAERGVPEELHPDVMEMRRAYDYGYHADNSRPLNTGIVSGPLTNHLIDSLCLWGDEDRWGGLLAELEAEGWDGVMLILGQATQLGVLTEIGARLQRLGHITAA
ncbi:MAG: LLM class flavin-dependent oxidoreductase [Actinobacteria bacterium]|nr:LLM class flavin-dependent oxidoreductase [Actinomycetota bacterium]